jgi:cell division protein FtsB
MITSTLIALLACIAYIVYMLRKDNIEQLAHKQQELAKESKKLSEEINKLEDEVKNAVIDYNTTKSEYDGKWKGPGGRRD